MKNYISITVPTSIVTLHPISTANFSHLYINHADGNEDRKYRYLHQNSNFVLIESDESNLFSFYQSYGMRKHYWKLRNTMKQMNTIISVTYLNKVLSLLLLEDLQPSILHKRIFSYQINKRNIKKIRNKPITNAVNLHKYNVLLWIMVVKIGIHFYFCHCSSNYGTVETVYVWQFDILLLYNSSIWHVTSK